MTASAGRRQVRFVRCPCGLYSDWDWQEVATHLRRHHDVDLDRAEQLALEAYAEACEQADRG